MKKKGRLLFFLISLTLIFVLGTHDNIAMAESGSQFYKVTIDGKLVSFTVDLGYPYLSQQNRTMVPIRIISENMGYVVTWDQTTTTVTISGNGDTLKLPVGKNTALKNGKEIYIDIQNGIPVDTMSVNINGRVYVPIRFIAEAMGGTVGYQGGVSNGIAAHEITITTGQTTPAPAQGNINFDLKTIPITSKLSVDIGVRGEDVNNCDFQLGIGVGWPLEQQYKDVESLLLARFGDIKEVDEILNYVKQKKSHTDTLESKKWTINGQLIDVRSGYYEPFVGVTAWYPQ